MRTADKNPPKALVLVLHKGGQFKVGTLGFTVVFRVKEFTWPVGKLTSLRSYDSIVSQ